MLKAIVDILKRIKLKINQRSNCLIVCCDIRKDERNSDNYENVCLIDLKKLAEILYRSCVLENS